MKRAARENFAKCVCHYYENIPNDRYHTVSHFADESQNRRFLYNILSRYERTGNSDYKNISGRKLGDWKLMHLNVRQFFTTLMIKKFGQRELVAKLWAKGLQSSQEKLL